MSFKIVRADITKMQTDAIVNTANESSIVGEGCDYAVYSAAGHDELLRYRVDKIGEVSEGDVFLTPGFNLEAKYIIHAVSPVYIDGQSGEEEKLRSCYRKSLRLALENGIKSIAFPLISTGSYGYPKEEGMRIAIDEINAFLLQKEMEIYLVVFDSKATMLGEKVYPDLDSYIDQNYVETARELEYGPGYFGSTGSAKRLEAARSVEAPKGQLRSSLQPAQAPQKSFYRTPIATEMSLERLAQKKVEKDSKKSFLGSVFHKDKKSKAKESEREKYSESAEDSDVEYCSSELPEANLRKVRPGNVDIEGASLQRSSFGTAGLQRSSFGTAGIEEVSFEEKHVDKLNERMQHLSDTFSEYLIYLIQERGMENADVYKRAIVDKKIFSKIKTNPNYHPNKLTALCLCVGAKLNLDESKDLLARAGYALSPCDKTDVIFSYFIENEIYDMIELDIQLEEHGLACIIS